MTFGEKIKAWRDEFGLSQEQFAQLVGTSKQVISRYESNQRTPKITVVQLYAKKMNVPVSFLVEESAPFPKSGFLVFDPSAPTIVHSDESADRIIAEECDNSVIAAAAHFDLDKLTDEGKRQYEDYIAYLAEKYSKE